MTIDADTAQRIRSLLDTTSVIHTDGVSASMVPRPPPTDESDRLRFDSKHKPNADGCWVWTAGVTTDGYGQFYARGRSVRAHCYAYETHVGPVPEGLILDHLCHNEDESCSGGHGCLHRTCVNPEHLEPVSLRANLERGRKMVGEVHGCSKLTEEQVLEIRAAKAASTNGYWDAAGLAKKYGVSTSRIGAVACGAGWSHLPGVEAKAAEDVYAERVQAISQSESWAEAAEKVGLTNPNSLRNWAKKNCGVKPKGCKAHDLPDPRGEVTP